jgi:hypothetical protein
VAVILKELITRSSTDTLQQAAHPPTTAYNAMQDKLQKGCMCQDLTTPLLPQQGMPCVTYVPKCRSPVNCSCHGSRVGPCMQHFAEPRCCSVYQTPHMYHSIQVVSTSH